MLPILHSKDHKGRPLQHQQQKRGYLLGSKALLYVRPMLPWGIWESKTKLSNARRRQTRHEKRSWSYR